MKKTGQQGPGSPSPSSNQYGTSRDVSEQMCPHPPSQEEASNVTSVPHPKNTSCSMELFNPWRDLRWYQIPLSSSRRPKAGLFSFTFQSSLEEYQQLRKSKNLKIGRPFSMPPLSALPLMLTDGSQEMPHKRQDSHRRSRAGEDGGKSLSHREEPQTSLRQMHTRSQKCRSSARFSPKRDTCYLGTFGQGQKNGPSSSPRKKQKQVDPGHSEPDLFLDHLGFPHLSTPGCPLAEASRSGNSSSMWGNPCSPHEEDQEDNMFPPDWTPPRIEFLYDEDPPPLSPAPGPASESQSSGEMPDITKEPAGLQGMEFIVEDSSPPGDHLHFLEEPVVLQPKDATLLELEGASPEQSRPSLCQVANEELEGTLVEDLTEANSQRALELEGPFLLSPIHPLAGPSTVYFRSSVSTSLDELAGDPERLTWESDEEGDLRPEFSSSPIPVHLLMTSSRIDSRNSISASSSNELSGDPGRLTLGSDMEEDVDDSDLVPLRDLLQMGNSNPGSVELDTFLSSEPDCYLSSLDKLLKEKREQTQADEELERNLGKRLLLSNSSSLAESADENAWLFPKAHRLILEQFSISQGTIPAVHPGECIFVLSPCRRTAVALDAAGLKPQNQLESFFFGSQFALQMALLQDGFLGSLYLGISQCPHPVLQWLFQLMSLNPDVSADAFQALWEISTHQVTSSADKVRPDLWCPKLKDITDTFYNLGACSSALYPPGLVQPEFRPKGLEFSEHPLGSADIKSESLPEGSPWHLTLTSVLGDIFKFLTLCVASHPHCYPDCQRLALLVLLCRLSLDRNLRKQPQMELQQLLLVLLEGIQDWLAKLPELCRSLCSVSQHHHNLVAVVRSFPDTTDRGRQLRRNLSLCFITKLLGKMQVAMSPWQEEIQLQQLVHLLPLMKPAFLKQGLQQEQRLREQPGRDQQEALAELDLEACYLCYSLLILANVIVGTTAVPLRDQEHLQQLSTQLQRHISASIREDPCLMYRTELKDLAAQTFVKWEELLSRGWLKITPCSALLTGISQDKRGLDASAEQLLGRGPE
ncbi:protein FAM178B isoform X2 [Rhineura floridana]|uniref:protein FAM178B isoform X2 n=1 Tax=Rhineura floridana TaxID=261503 RepID=UPI002AC88508|nr:protein FAM178B isoform X2 [Rhineura floridana]